LAGDLSRDKDGVLASALVSCMASYYKEKGLTLLARLKELFTEHGYFLDGLLTMAMDDLAQKKLMARIRRNPPRSLAGLPVTKILDYINGYDEVNNSVIKPLPPTNLLQFVCGEQAIVSIRPSGTEPKVKVYISLSADNEGEAQNLLRDCQRDMSKLLSDPSLT